MNEPLPERVARLETENEQCALERASHATMIKELRDAALQMRGSVRTMVVLFAIVSSAGTVAAVKYVVRELVPGANAAAVAPRP